MNFYFLEAIGLWLVFGIVMFIFWIILNRINFLSGVDLVWAFGIGLIGFGVFITLPKWHWRGVAVLLLLLLWSFRLGFHLFRRLRHYFPQEDARYQKLKDDWGAQIQRKSFIFFQFQGVTQAILIYPILLTFMDFSPSIRGTDILGIGVTLIGLIGEGIADRQLSQFKNDSRNVGQVCQKGLWKFSRHPNYFFEWLVWVGFAVVASALSPVVFTAPLMMYVLLVHVTGVKPAEISSLRSKGVLYSLYQRSTNSFFPWWPKKRGTQR